MRRATPLRDGPGSPALTLHFDGAPIAAAASDTVASALIAAGELMTSRSAKYRRPRGAYCLQGDCGTCLVRVDGQPNVRACLTPVRAGSRVRGRFKLLDFAEKRPGQFQQTTEFTVEIEGQDKPALIAEWIGQAFV